MPEYIRWDAPGVEVIQDGEDEKKKEIAKQFLKLQEMSFNLTCHAMRATHLKTQGVNNAGCLCYKDKRLRRAGPRRQDNNPRQSPRAPGTRHVC